jgi:hypothetical protein
VFINKGVAITEYLNVFVEWDSGLLEGQSQLCGTSFPQVLQWGGLDDFLIPDPEEDEGAYIMHIDSQDLVNVSAGKLQIRFDADMNVTKMSGFFPELFELKNPVKQ